MNTLSATVLAETLAGRSRVLHRSRHGGDRSGPVPAEEPKVFIIDAERAVREALQQLFESVSIKSLAFGSVDELLAYALPDDS